MSERLHPSNHEKLPGNVEAQELSRKNLERIHEEAARSEKDPLQKQLESLEQRAQAEAVSGKELNVGDSIGESTHQGFGINKALKADAYKRSLHKIQTHLSRPDRALSRVIHNRAVENVSNVAGKTIARPSAFLGASMGAFIGSAALLFMARYYGFSYNYTVFLILFAGGLVTGLLIELLWRALFRRRSSF